MTFTVADMHRVNDGAHFEAYSLRGVDYAFINPFIGVDHAWMSAPTFPPHAHAGLSAISYLFLDSETGIANRDSLGSQNLISPGGLHWAAAGKGIVHEENPAEVGKTVHLLQIFINLPRTLQNAAPFVLSLPPQDVPVMHKNGVAIRVPLGSFEHIRSPITPPTEVTMLDITLDKNTEFTIHVPTGLNAFFILISGALRVENQWLDFQQGHVKVPLFLAQPESRTINMTTHNQRAQLVFFSGTPLL